MAWRRDELRVACKSSGLNWESGKRRWTVLFSKVKTDECDELLLALYTPRGVYVHRHDGQLGLSMHGKSTAATGRVIQVAGPRGAGAQDWRAALDVILEKLESRGCARVAEIGWS